VAPTKATYRSVWTFFVAGAVAWTVQSCAHSITVRSRPAKAAVYSIDKQGKRGPKLGETPLVVDSTAAGEPVQLEVEMPGYLPRNLLIAPSGARNAEFDVTLLEVDESTSKSLLRGAGSGAINAAVSDLLELQTEMLYTDNDKRIEELLRVASQKYADLSVFHTLYGAYSLNRKDLKRARESFRRALELDPKNEEASRMLGQLSKGRK